MTYCNSYNNCALGMCPHIRTHGMDPWGSEHPLLYIVGEAPGAIEDQQGIPFIGPAGELLRDILRRMGVDLQHVRINNVVRCAPWVEKDQKIGTPNSKQIETCLPYLLSDITRTKPRIILALGGIATKALTRTHAQITTIRGSVQSINIGEEVFTVIPALHPSYIRRQGSDVTLLTFLMADVKKAWAFATGLQAPEAKLYQGRDYGMLRSLEEVKAYVDLVIAKCTADPAMFITADFEAGKLEEWQPDNPMIGLGISYGPYQARFIPMEHFQSPMAKQVPELAKILAPLASVPISNQNIKFDYQWWKRRLGIELQNIRFDTMLGHHCKFAGTRPNDLETMAGLYLQEPAWSYKLVDSVNDARTYIKAQLRAAKKEKNQQFFDYWHQWEILGKMSEGYAVAQLEQIATYCCVDADTTWRLTPYLEQMLVHEGLYESYRNNYHSGIKVFAEMQYEGIAIDNTVVHQLKEELPGEMKKIEVDINSTKYVKQAMTLLGKDPEKEYINMGSPQQMATLIYDAMKLPPARSPGKSQRTTEAGQLEQLLGYCKRKEKKNAVQLLEMVGEWRSLGKYLSSYVESNIKYQDSRGLVHPTWNLMGTRTGRMACDSPPVHSAPTSHGLRKQYFSRWHEYGGIILGADESQIEVRIFASLAQDLALINFYCNMKGADLHRYMASLLFSVPYDQVTSEQRRIAKTCVFASLYGGGAGNLAEQTGMPMGEAKVVHARFTALISIEKFKSVKTDEMMTHGYVTTPFGRCLPISIGNTESQQKHAVRQAMNTPIQSTASDIVARAIIRAQAYMQAMGLKSRIIIFHHDAVYWDVYPGELFTLLWLANRVLVEEPMAMYPWLRVPLKIGIEFGNSWGDKIEVESYDDHSLSVKFKAEKDEDQNAFYDRYYKHMVRQFEGPMSKVLQMQNIHSDAREIVALVTPRMAG